MTALGALVLARSLGLLSTAISLGSALLAVLAVFQVAKMAKRAEEAAIRSELSASKTRRYAEEVNEIVADHEVQQILFGAPATKGEEVPF